ncbi:MAG: presenilin family intramembrane aspartyl protease PSH [Haloferacaceae archaeon]
MNARVFRGATFAALVFLLVQVGSLALVPTFFAQGYQTVENPADPVNSLVYVGAILVATVLMLAAFRYDFQQAVRAVVLFSSALLSWYVFSVVLPSVLLAAALSAGVAVALLLYPEWYVVDTAGVLMGAGAGALFGISFGLLPAIVLLTVLAVYDAISVYGTEHMLSLAEGVMDLRIPVVLVIPLSLSYSLLEDDFAGAAGVHEDDDEGGENGIDGAGSGGDSAGSDVSAGANAAADDGADGPGGGGATERDALFIGLGDAVMPTVMVASAAFFSPATSLGLSWLPALNLPALTSMVGIFAGLAALLWAVLKGRAHAGLPLLNGGAILGYLVGSFAAGVPLLQALGVAQFL